MFYFLLSFQDLGLWSPPKIFFDSSVDQRKKLSDLLCLKGSLIVDSPKLFDFILMF